VKYFDAFMFAALSVLAISPSPTHAATIASSTLVIPQVYTDGCCHVEHDVSFTYMLLITGGTGSGTAFLDAFLYAPELFQPYATGYRIGAAADVVIQTGGFGTRWAGLVYDADRLLSTGHDGSVYVRRIGDHLF
jgi:hypothetical protein